MPNIGFINSGGDCPGLNTVMDAVVRSLHPDYKILGFLRGFEGLLEKQYTVLDPSYTTNYKFTGGTVLKSVNKGNFAMKVGMGQTSSLEESVLKQTKKSYDELELEGLIVLGGDGTLSVACELEKVGINTIAVPKSIDNDLLGTDFTFGFQTAVEIAKDALDKLETTAFSHDRVMILEVMGRNAGWIGLFSGIAGGANMILIPEIPFKWEIIKEFLEKRSNVGGKKNTLIVVSEGAKAIDGEIMIKNIGSKASEVTLGGIGEQIATYINQFPEFEARSTSLGHIQRGGSPNATDRILSRLYGAHAASLFRKKQFGRMVAYQKGIITDIDIKSSVEKIKLVEENSHIVEMVRNMKISFGDKM